MAKKKPQIDDALTTSEAPEAAPAKKVVPLPVFQGFEATPEPEGMQDVWLIGGGPLDGAYRIPIRIPQELSVGAANYDLSDRAAGVYVWRHR
jgi:hypothetical protein